MTRREWILLAGVVLIGAMALWPTRSGPSEGATRVITRIDSLTFTKPADVAQLQHLEEQRRSALVSARRSQDSANAARVTADSLGAVAEAAGSSAAQWQAAYVARSAEAVQLRFSNDSLHNVIRADSGRIVLLSTRLAVTESVLAQARTQLLKGDDCKIARIIPCPSRKQAFFIGLGTGEAVRVGIKLAL